MSNLHYPYRDIEVDGLRKQLWLAQNDGRRLSFVYGRNYLGKKKLVLEALKEDIVMYLSIGGKNDSLALQEQCKHCAKQLGGFVPRSISTLAELFDFLCDEAWKRSFSLVIENVQEIPERMPGFIAHLVKKWRTEPKKIMMNLVLICDGQKAAEELALTPGAPLKNVTDAVFKIEPLSIATVRSIQQSAATQTELKPFDLFSFYMMTGGRPNLVRAALEAKAYTAEKILQLLLADGSAFAVDTERSIRHILGKNSDTYLSILQLIATGVKSQAEMEQKLGGMVIGGHLAKLETEYELIRKTRPLLSSPESRGIVRYHIQDPALCMWLRLILADDSASFLLSPEERIETAKTKLLAYLKEDLTYYLIQKFRQEETFSSMGSDWSAQARISKQKTVKYKVEEQPKIISPIDIVGLRGKKAVVAAVCPEASEFKKEPFWEQVNVLKNGPLKGYGIDARLFTLNDVL